MKFNEFLRRICPISDRVAHDQLRFTVEDLQQAHRDATEEVAKAHKRGWEQAKREAVNLAVNWRDASGISCSDRLLIAGDIAAMEYGGKANDHTN